MKKYKVKLKGTDQEETITAKSELEAKVRYCQKKGLNYILFAGKLEAQPSKKS